MSTAALAQTKHDLAVLQAKQSKGLGARVAHLSISRHLNPRDMMNVPVVLELVGLQTCKELRALGTQRASDDAAA